MSIEQFENDQRLYKKRMLGPKTNRTPRTPKARPEAVNRRRQVYVPSTLPKASASSKAAFSPAPVPIHVSTPLNAPVHTMPTGATSTPKKRTYLEEEGWAKGRDLVAARTYDIEHFSSVPYIHWGSGAKDSCAKFVVKVFSNTCPLDNFMMIMLYLYRKNQRWKEYVDRPRTIFGEKLFTMMRMLDHPRGPKANKARRFWVLSVQDPPKTEKDEMDLQGLEDEEFLKYFRNLSEDYKVIRSCRCGYRCNEVLPITGQCHSRVPAAVNHINAGGLQIRCPICGYKFMHNEVVKPLGRENVLPVIAIGVANEKDKMDKLPNTVDVLGDEYTLFACTVQSRGPKLAHYRAAIRFNNKWFTYDGMKTKFEAGKPSHNEVSTAWYRIGSP